MGGIIQSITAHEGVPALDNLCTKNKIARELVTLWIKCRIATDSTETQCPQVLYTVNIILK